MKNALVRPPGASFTHALSSSGAPLDVKLAQAQHAEYRQALAEAGLAVDVLPADERYPDGCFVQDPGLVVAGRAVIGRMGAPSRIGEEDAIAAYFAGRLPMSRLVAPGTLEGGDVLALPDRVLVGSSGRTNRAGIAQLAVALAGTSLWVTEVQVTGFLHLLSAVTHLGSGLLLAAEVFASHPALAGLELLVAPQEEAYAANTLGIDGYAIMPAGYPKVASMLGAQGFQVLPVPVSEFTKADGGVTCLSLVW